MYYSLARSIDEFDSERWDALVGDQIEMSSRWQRVMERCWRGYRPRYVLLEDGRGPAAIAVINTAQSFSMSGWKAQVMRRLSMVVGPPFSSTCEGVMIRPDLAPADVLAALDPALHQLCLREQRLLVGVSNISAAARADWEGRGFLSLARPGYAVLVPPATLEEYEQALSRRDRMEMHRVRRHAAAGGAHFLTGSLDGDGAALYPLMQETFVYHGTAPEAMPLGDNFFEVLEQEMAENVVVFRGFLGEELAIFALALRSGPALRIPLLGMRYALARPHLMYFAMLDEQIQWAMTHGIGYLCAGLTNEAIKQRYGYHLEPRYFCYRLYPPALTGAVKLFFPLARRMFKEDSTSNSPESSGEKGE